MTQLIHLELFTDFFNKIGQKATSDGGWIANPFVIQRRPGGAPPVVTGTDIAVFEHGRIRSLYAFIDESASI
jgi:hypothetical protein